MLSDKRGQGLSLNTIVIALIVLTVLVVIIVIFTGALGNIVPGFQKCSVPPNQCALDASSCDKNDGFVYNPGLKCENKAEFCCQNTGIKS